MSTNTKQRYQLFRKVEKISFDDIKTGIELISTPCSEIFELTDEEYTAFLQVLYNDWSYDQVELRRLSRWFSTDEIMNRVKNEMENIQANLQRQLLLNARRGQRTTKKTAKKAITTAKAREKKLKDLEN